MEVHEVAYNNCMFVCYPSYQEKVDKLVQHPHRVTQDQFSLVSEKENDSGIPEDNLHINMELF